MQDKIKELETAKKNVATLLADAKASIDFHGIAYWAGRVEALRDELEESIP